MARGRPALAAELLNQVLSGARFAIVPTGEDVPVRWNGNKEDTSKSSGASAVAASVWLHACARGADSTTAMLVIEESNVDGGGCSGERKDDGRVLHVEGCWVKMENLKTLLVS